MNTHHGWKNPYRQPDSSFVIESPHVFRRNDKWWLFSTIDQDTVWGQANSTSPIDTTSAGADWEPVQKLSDLVPLGQGNFANYFHASEYLQASANDDVEYLAGWNDAQPGILFTQMKPAPSHDPPLLFSMACPSAAGVDKPIAALQTPRLLLTGVRPARSSVSMRVEWAAVMRVRVSVYDVLGRRLKTLVDGYVPAGTTELTWDGRDRDGAMVGSGVFFVSLTAKGTRRSVRVPLIR